MGTKIVFVSTPSNLLPVAREALSRYADKINEATGYFIVFLDERLRLLNPEDLDRINKAELQSILQPDPIPMILHCPSCHVQHIDAPEYADPHNFKDETMSWDNPPHRSHLCHRCGTIWRPADVPTVGVEKIQTKGKSDIIKHLPTMDTSCSIGVGKGTGNLFVYGSHEAIKLVQGFIMDAEKHRVVKKCAPGDHDWVAPVNDVVYCRKCARLAMICSRCEGAGKIETGFGVTRRITTCPYCNGQKNV